MALPDSYTIKTGAIRAYFEAMKNAEAPERFSSKFLQDLEFTSSNDRLFVGILKDLGFIDQDGKPTERYYHFLDKKRSEQIIADGIREAYSDLFSVHKEAHKLNVEDCTNKLRTLYKGAKKDSVIKNIAKTFVALCEVADFSKPASSVQSNNDQENKIDSDDSSTQAGHHDSVSHKKHVKVAALQYHINISLPETRDQAVYDAIFKSLRDHLG